MSATEALIEAVENHDKSEVDRLIAAGVDVNEIDRQGETALLCAVKNNVELEIIKALVENGNANINALDRYGRSSLFYALTKSKETASYLFKKEEFFNESSVPGILSYFLESLCTKMYDSHPTIDELLLILQEKGLEPRNLANELAKSIVNILLCKLPLLLTLDIECHRSNNTMFHLQGKRKYFLEFLKKITECECMENYARKESIKEVLKKIEDRRENVSDILKLLKKHSPDPKFADSYGNTALHYAACLPWMWMGAPQEIIREICEKLCCFGFFLIKMNSLHQTPLLFCLSGSMGHLEDNDKLKAMKRLVEVCEFLVKRGSRLKETTKNGESVFHLVIKLFQQGFEIPDRTIRQGVVDETMKLLKLFSPFRMGKVARNKAGDLLNSPLHLWASLVLTVPVQEYTCFVTRELTFEKVLKIILTHLLRCGASKNDRNRNEETPLHVCNTWTAVNLLIDVGARPNDVDSLKRTPLLVAASKQTFLKNPFNEKSRFYPDVHQEAKPFFEMAVEKKLDPWKVDTNDESVLGFLIASEIYDLSKALVEVACNLKEKDKSQKVFVSLLKAICKDESQNTHWKIELAEKILSCAKERGIDGVVSEPFDICCKRISELSDKVNNEQPTSNTETSEDLERKKIENTLHCSIAKILRLHGAELSGASYEALKKKCKEIDQILQDTEVQKLVPWTSRSKTHKDVLDKVARLKEYQKIGESVCCHNTPAESFGADLFVGINKQNSREVVVKRMGEIHCTQDLKNLYAQLDSEQIFRYFFHLEGDEVHQDCMVFELMEGNLDHYLGSDAFDRSKGASLCGDIIKGLNYLHKHEINHFQDHLKPTSIFYITHPKLCLKITDFDHSRPADGTATYVWSSPEVLKKPENHSKSSDLFSCGLLLHYILSEGKHPFRPADCTSKSKLDIVSETELNIKDGKRKVDDSLSPEGVHLVKQMLDDRPPAIKALDHPLFWSKKKKMDLLIAVGNQSCFEYPRAGRTIVLSGGETHLEAQFGTIVKYVEWNDPGYVHMPAIYTEMIRRRRYDTCSVVELVRLIRNAHAYVSESTRPTPMRKQMLEDFVFLEYFPNLVIDVYKAVTSHGWDQNREEIKYAMK